MLFGKYYNSIISIQKKKKVLFAIASLSMTLGFMFLIFYKGFFLDVIALLGSVVNPPGFTEIVYAVLVMIVVFFICKIAKDLSYKPLKYLAKGLDYLGSQTLYIFLYHRLFLDFFLNRLFGGLNMFIKVPLFYFVMIFGSILLGIIYKWSAKKVKASYSRSCNYGKNNAQSP